MKKRSTLFLLLITIIMPTVVCASSFTLSCDTSVDKYGTANCSVVVTPDESDASISGSISVSDNLQLLSSSSISGLSTTINVKGVNIGTGTVTVSVTVGEEYLDSQSATITVNEATPEEEVDLSLKSLSVDGNSIDVSSGSSSYTYTTDKDSVTISAKGAEGTSVSVTGSNIKLNEGSNPFQITVSKEGAQPKTYNLTIIKNKKEENNADSPKLKSIKLSSGSINFNPSTLEYNVSVDSNINSVTVTAEGDSGAQIKYSPSSSVNLKYGETKAVSIIVLKDGGSVTYKVNITRQDVNTDTTGSSNIAVGNLKLKSLTIDEIPFTFDPNNLEYNLNVENNIEEITLKYEVNDPSLSAKVVGNTQLKEGKNKIKIVVSTESGKSNTYILNITRNKTRTVVENKEESIIEKLNDESDKNDIYVIVDSKDDKKLSTNILEALKSSKKKLTYEIIKNSGILYSVYFDGAKINNTNDFNYQITLISDNEKDIYELIKTNKYLTLRFKEDTDIPGEVKLNIYVGDTKIKDLKKVNLYKYKNNNLQLVKKDIKIDDGYIDIILDSNSEYVLGKYNKIKNAGSDKSQILTALVIIVLSFIISVVLIIIKKKRNKKKIKQVD